MIKAENISVKFNDREVVSSLSFVVSKGEKVCIIGGSGKGKSTVVNTVLGLVPLNSGDIYINDIKLSSKTIHQVRNHIAWLPQNFNIPVSTANEILTDYLGISISDDLIKILESLRLSKDFLFKNVEEVSGGEKQRIFLSICLSFKRPILLLDEPTSALDEGSVEIIMDKIMADKELTVLMATHNPTAIERCTGIIDLNK